jgi:hypothetical protein
MSTTKFPVVPLTDVLADPCELEVNGLAVFFRRDEPTDSQSPSIGDRGEIVFEVRGLQPGYKAWIVQENDACQVMRETGDAESEWLGKYSSVEDALRALSHKIML